MNSKRPKLNEAVRYFRHVYDDVGGSVSAAGKYVGGKVDYNVNKLTVKQGKFENLCAIRLSYVLNNTGFKISKMGSKTVSGENGNWYLYRVEDMIKHLTKLFGKPDMSFVAPTPEKLAGNKGIIVFEVDGWINALGHAPMDIKKLVTLVLCIILAACGSHATKPVKEELYFKNFGLAICFASSFDSEELAKDTNKAVNGYIQRGNMSLDVYDELRDLVKVWQNKDYQSKDGGQVNSAKCIDLYNSDDLHQLYLKHTPCKSLDNWWDKKDYKESCK